MNEDFEIEDLKLEPEKPAKTGKKAKISAKKQAMLDSIMSASDDEIDDMPAPVGATVLDENGKHKRRNIRIIIDEMAGVKDNFEVVSVNGNVYQIKRGIPVEVPPEVVHVLELAQMTHIEQKKNPYTGDLEEVTRNFSAVPWRRA